MTLHKEFWGLLFIFFVVLIFITGDAHQRIERACKPIDWVGSVVVSLSALVLPQHQVRVKGWFDGLDYGCQYTVWRVFYQDDYNAWVAQQAKISSAPVGVAPVNKTASAPVASAPKALPLNTAAPSAPSAPVKQ